MSDAPDTRIRPVILSGGSGARLWPLSRLGRPKQLIALAGDGSMIQQTISRVADPDRFSPPLIVAGADHGDEIARQLAEAGASPERIILEPHARNTALAVAMAALASPGDDLLLVLPSDHVVARPEAFAAAVARARPAAEQGWIVAFGIEPDRPETGYGYLQRGEPVGEGVWRADRFAEKPARQDAERWLGEGGWYWNAGIFLFRRSVFLAELERQAPEIAGVARDALAGAHAEGDRLYPESGPLEAAPSRSVDRAVMEKAARLALVPVDMGWSDVGSWEAIHALGPKDGDGNVVAGDVVAVDSRECLIRSDGPVVVTLGVENLIVVATERAVLVASLGAGQRVQEAIDALRERRRPAGET